MHLSKHYSRSPLTEAVLNLQVTLPAEVSLEILAEMQKGQEVDYPIRRNRLFLQTQISKDPETPPTIGSRTHIGYDFVSRDERQIVQVRLDGFTFSRLAPYQGWISFRDEARRWWNIYRAIVQPKAIHRVAIRYINRLDLPLPLRDLKDYLRTVPEVSSALPQDLSSYFMQLQIPQEDLQAVLILNEALVPSPNSEVVSVLLDIDLFREDDLPNEEKALWEFFEQLRLRKNEVFEACITEQTKELIR